MPIVQQQSIALELQTTFISYFSTQRIVSYKIYTISLILNMKIGRKQSFTHINIQYKNTPWKHAWSIKIIYKLVLLVQLGHNLNLMQYYAVMEHHIGLK